MSFDKLFDGSDAHLIPDGLAECAAFLRNFNKWRRGDESIEMPDPAEIGLNIDFAVATLESISDAVLRERDACADIAECYTGQPGDHDGTAIGHMIRSRGKE